MKACLKCQKDKEFSEFYKNSHGYLGLHSYCKSCLKEHSMGYLKTEEGKKTRKKYAQSLKGIEARKRYSRTEKFKSNLKRYENSEKGKFMRNSNIHRVLASKLRIRMNMALKGKNKVGSAVRDLGCSMSEFKIYLESKFQPGMIWENHGLQGWHLDHIKPLASFDLTNREEFLKAAHYTNLQPLWSRDNIKKGCKLG